MEARFRLPFDAYIERMLHPEPFDLPGLSELILSWSGRFGEPATDAEWLAALEAGQIEPSYDE